MKPKKIDYAALGNELRRHIDASGLQVATLRDRWHLHYKLFVGDPGVVSGPSGAAPMSVPILKSRTARIAQDINGGLFSSEPVVQGTFLDGSRSDDFDHDMQFLIDQSGLVETFNGAVFHAIMANLGLFRISPKVENGKVAGLETDFFKPEHVICYPSNAMSLEQSITHGHRFYLPKSAVEAKQESGEWEKVSLTPSASPSEDTRLPGQYDKEIDPDLLPDNQLIELAEVITTHKSKKYIVTFAVWSGAVLRCDPWPDEYPATWYVNCQLESQEHKVFCSGSLAYGVQTLCLEYAYILNMMSTGVAATALPPLVEEGVIIDQGARKYLPGEILTTSQGSKIYPLIIPFDYQKCAALLSELRNEIDQTLGVSALSAGGELPSGTTATAVNAVLAGEEQRSDSYQDEAAKSLESAAKVIHRLFLVHFNDLQQAFEGGLRSDPAELQKPVTLIASGRASGDPKIKLRKLAMVREFAMRPDSNFDINKVEKMIVEELNLSMTTESLMKDRVTMIEQLATVLDLQGVDVLPILQELEQHVTATTQQGADANLPVGPPVQDGGEVLPTQGGPDANGMPQLDAGNSSMGEGQVGNG